MVGVIAVSWWGATKNILRALFILTMIRLSPDETSQKVAQNRHGRRQQRKDESSLLLQPFLLIGQESEGLFLTLQFFVEFGRQGNVTLYQI